MAEVNSTPCIKCGSAIPATLRRSDGLPRSNSRTICHSCEATRKHASGRKRPTALPEQPCFHCSSLFVPKFTNQIYCRKLCKRQAWNKANPDRDREYQKQNGIRQYQLTKQSERYRLAKARRKLIAVLRKIRRQKQLTAGREVIRVKKCKVCGGTLLLVAAHARTELCDTCRALNLQQATKKYRRSRRKKYGRDWKSVARRLGVPYERVVRTKIFERDGWRCQICNKLTPKARLGKHGHNEPTIDHRVPITKGGPHTYANIQCACRDCNTKKGNTSSLGQLPMFS